MTRSSFLVVAALVLSGCASQNLKARDLDSVSRPAFISRFEDDAGPHSRVFSEDATYTDKLKKLAPTEADRRLAAKLEKAVTRFEVSERLRVATVRQLPAERPWTTAVDPAQVASVLEIFLVQPSGPPDYDLLKPLGADSVVEFVIQDYGMRSEKGRAGAFLKGYARMFWLKGRAEIWHHNFKVDQVAEGAEHLDPFKVGKDPAIFRTQLTDMLEPLAEQFAKELSPKDRNPNAPRPELTAPDSVNTTGHHAPPPKPQEPPLPPGELPDPDS